MLRILRLLLFNIFAFEIKGLTQFETQALNTHNNYRKIHGAPPLKWNATIAKYALAYAKTLAATNSLNINPARLYGENGYYASKWNVNGKDPVDFWYREIKNYDFKHPGFDSKSSQFTQVVWKDSKQLGMAYFTTPNRKTWVVANYDPMGNYLNEYEQNVYPKGTSLKVIEKVTLQQFQKDALDSHNEFRKAHGAPPLKWSNKLTNYAFNYAKVLAKTDIMKHNPENKYGENIFYSIAMLLDGKLPACYWYSEIKDYDFNKPGFSKETGHFTQLIWKNIKEMGMAWVKTDKGKIWVVANYDPPGNFIDSFRENVLPKRGKIDEKFSLKHCQLPLS